MSEIAGLGGKYVFNFIRQHFELFSKVAAPCFSPSSKEWEFQFLDQHSVLSVFVFRGSHPGRYRVAHNFIQFIAWQLWIKIEWARHKWHLDGRSERSLGEWRFLRESGRSFSSLCICSSQIPGFPVNWSPLIFNPLDICRLWWLLYFMCQLTATECSDIWSNIILSCVYEGVSRWG